MEQHKQGMARRKEAMTFFGFTSATSFYQAIRAGTVPKPKFPLPSTPSWDWDEMYEAKAALPTEPGEVVS